MTEQELTEKEKFANESDGDLFLDFGRDDVLLLIAEVRRLRAALAGFKYKPEQGEPDRYCDHAAEPCRRCQAAREALGEQSEETKP